MVLDSLVNESYEYLLEFQNTIHELDMKMIKCEHHCIVNEDSNMMMLAEEEYNSKFIATVKAIWNKIAVTILDFIQTLRSLVMKARQKFANKEVKAQIDKAMNDPNTRNELKKVFYNKAQKVKYFDVIKNKAKFDELIKGAFSSINNNFTKESANAAKEKLSSYLSKQSEKVEPSPEAFRNAYEILTRDGEEWIGLLNKAKEEASKHARLVGKDRVSAEESANATAFQVVVNKIIFSIQSVITDSFKIVYAIRGSYSDDDRATIKDKDEEIEKLNKRINELTEEVRKSAIAIYEDGIQIVNMMQQIDSLKDEASELKDTIEKSEKIRKELDSERRQYSATNYARHVYDERITEPIIRYADNLIYYTEKLNNAKRILRTAKKKNVSSELIAKLETKINRLEQRIANTRRYIDDHIRSIEDVKKYLKYHNSGSNHTMKEIDNYMPDTSRSKRSNENSVLDKFADKH